MRHPTAIPKGDVMRFTAVLAVLFCALSFTASTQTQTIRIRATTVLDGTGKVLRNATIVVSGSRITSIETGSSTPATYSLGQATVMPGMIDVHSHIGWHFDKDGRYANRPGSPAQEILYAAENAYFGASGISAGLP